MLTPIPGSADLQNIAVADDVPSHSASVEHQTDHLPTFHIQVQAQFDVAAPDYDHACACAINQAMQLEFDEWSALELLHESASAKSCVLAIEFDAEVLRDLMDQVDAMLGRGIRLETFDQDGMRGTTQLCLTCLRASRETIVHDPSCPTGQLAKRVANIRAVIAQCALSGRPGVCAAPAAAPASASAPAEPVAQPTRTIVCGEEIRATDGVGYMCGRAPEHEGWHVDTSCGKAWPSLAAWPVALPVCDAAEIGVTW